MKYLGYCLALWLCVGQAVAELQIVSAQTSLDPIEVSSLVQGELQAQGFSMRFVQPIDKGLKKYNKQQDYFRVILFNPPAQDIPNGAAGDALHAFIPLRIVVAKVDKGTQVSALPYAEVLHDLPPQAHRAMQRWGGIVREIIETLPKH